MGDVDQHTKLAAVLFLKENEHLQSELLDMCSENPLALHRMSQVYSAYNSPKQAMASIENHEKRVLWQVHRIYRARNNLVHAGKVPTYLPSLVVNMDEYFRAAIGTLVNRATKETDQAEIDQLVFEISVEYKLKIQMLKNLKIKQDKEKSGEKITPEILRELVR